MKNIILIFGIVLLTVISSNAQDSLKKISSENKETITINEDSNILYDSIYDDFENYYRMETEKENIEDNEMENIYNDIYDSFEIIEQISNEQEKDEYNNILYSNLLDDTMKNK